MRFLIIVLMIFAAPYTAHAAQPCQNPAGDEGDQVYNITYHVMQYCNGSHWVAMGSVMGQGDNLGDHAAGQALDMGGFRIQNLAPPTADNHAVTRAYVTSAIAAIPAPTIPNLSAVLAAGNAAGNRKITGLATPTASTDAATMAYADTKVSKAGDTMTGNLSVPAPNANPHAATKQYVDTVVASASGGVGGALCYCGTAACESGYRDCSAGCISGGMPVRSSGTNCISGGTNWGSVSFGNNARACCR